MLFTRATELKALRITTSALQERIQQLSAELAELRARIPTLDDSNLVARLAACVSRAQATAGRQLDQFLAGVHTAAETAAMLNTQHARRGRPGGLARARTAWRYFDGTFMPESEKKAAYLEEYERHAAGGREPAARALRLADGTFAPNVDYKPC